MSGSHEPWYMPEMTRLEGEIRQLRKACAVLKAENTKLRAALRIAAYRLNHAGMLGGKEDPVNAALDN